MDLKKRKKNQSYAYIMYINANVYSLLEITIANRVDTQLFKNMQKYANVV